MIHQARFTVWLVLAALVLLLLGSCAPATPTQPAASYGGEGAAPAQASGQLTLRFYTSSGDHATKANELMINKFRETHPDFTVEVEYGASDYADKVFTMAAAGNLPDILYTADIYTAPFVDAGVLLDMQPFADADSEVNIDDVYESILGLGRVEGNPGLYMIPVSLDNVQVYYNKTIWEEAGAPLPTPDWSWDDLIADCKIIQEAKPDIYCIGIGGSNGGGGFNWWAYVVPWIRGYGGDVLSADGTRSTLSTPEAMAGLQAYANLWVVHNVAIPLGNDLGGNCFINQKCATWLSIPIFAGIFRDSIEPGAFEWDVQVIPSHPKGRFTGMGTFGYAVSANTQHPQEAWDFVKTLITREGQEELGRTYRAMPLLKSMADSSLFDELEPPPANYRAFIDGQAYGILPRTYPVECGSLYTGQVNAAMMAALETIIRGEGTAETVFPGVDAEIQACLDRALAK
ncbi:sugar ABC transporter substrate-binding protein [Litorilinea aerophila]|uniref:Sugar ABC transporter substrate-binding protein n=1 Tax=Litorilinea aerophila TaxID=1204385 RepID=A0A540VIH4_9CHLR|nr:sugar ABC transporter substrate-binding protein [Litorilinea aerophila]MCC9075792.1 sugar ABC transporter substrate-binding protein [Litorilinea aerophila]